MECIKRTWGWLILVLRRLLSLISVGSELCHSRKDRLSGDLKGLVDRNRPWAVHKTMQSVTPICLACIILEQRIVRHSGCGHNLHILP